MKDCVGSPSCLLTVLGISGFPRIFLLWVLNIGWILFLGSGAWKKMQEGVCIVQSRMSHGDFGAEKAMKTLVPISLFAGRVTTKVSAHEGSGKVVENHFGSLCCFQGEVKQRVRV